MPWDGEMTDHHVQEYGLEIHAQRLLMGQAEHGLYRQSNQGYLLQYRIIRSECKCCCLINSLAFSWSQKKTERREFIFFLKNSIYILCDRFFSNSPYERSKAIEEATKGIVYGDFLIIFSLYLPNGNAQKPYLCTKDLLFAIPDFLFPFSDYLNPEAGAGKKGSFWHYRVMYCVLNKTKTPSQPAQLTN